MPDLLTPEQLAEIAEREAKATKGPWKADTAEPFDCVVWGAADDQHIGNVGANIVMTSTDREIFSGDISNTEFIAHARTDIPALLRHIAALEARTRRRDELLSELAQAINSTSTENASNTPDFILANFAAACLDAFAEASVAREAWYGKSLSIDGKTSDIAALEARTPALHPTGHSEFLSEGCFPEAPLEVQPGANFKPTRDLDAVLPPAPATDVDALLAEAEDEAPVAGSFRDLIQRLATALRESLTERDMAREQLAKQLNAPCPHRAAIKERTERQKTLPEGTYADRRDDTDKDCGYLLNKTHEMRREINSLKAQRDAAIARAEKAEADLADLTQTTGELCPECHWRGVRDDGCEFCKAHRLEADLAAARAELGALGAVEWEASSGYGWGHVTESTRARCQGLPGWEFRAIRVVKEAQ